MPYASHMELYGMDGANIFEMKGWRWDDVLQREIKIHPTKSFHTTEPNPPLALDFGSYTRHYALQGRLNTQRQFNRLKHLVAVDWYETAANQSMVSLKIGNVGADVIYKNGIIEQLHVDWNAKRNYMIATIKFYNTVYFIF